MINTDTKEAILLKKIDVSQAGNNCSLRIGDLTGDGRMDFVLVEPDNIVDERYFSHSVLAATAYNTDGDMLWQIGKPSETEIVCTADVPAQIYDIDRDGYNEFICITEGMFCIFDGKTGELKRKFPLPDENAHDSFVFANLDGSGYAQNIILKNRFHQMWAMDKNFNVLWTYKGNIGYFPIVCDLNKDGKDEIIAGKIVLDSDGNILWELDRVDFPKTLCVGDIDMTGEYSIIAGGEKTDAYNSQGEIKWSFRNDTYTNAFSIGNIRTDIFGFELAGYFEEYSDEYTDGVFIVDYHGNTIFKEKRPNFMGYEAIKTIYNFDGNRNEYLVVSYKEDNRINIYDGNMTSIYYINGYGKIYFADILGDGVSQIISYDGSTLNIYSESEIDITKPVISEPRPQERKYCNYTEYEYYLQDLSKNAIGYVTGQFSKPDIKAWAKQYALGEEEEPITRADFCVLIVDVLGIKGYTIDLFFDVSINDYYAPSIASLKHCGYIDNIIGKFLPNAPLTAEFAKDILTRATELIPLTTKSGEEELTKKDVAKIILQIEKII